MGAGATVGAIDIGTNTALLLVAAGAAASPVAVLERATITRLGKGVDRTGALAPDAMERTLECLAEYGELLRVHAVRRTEVVCTSAARDATNGAEFLARARVALGAVVRIIGGAEEAALTFEGALTGLIVPSPVTVFDVGGGSTEVIHARFDGAGGAPSIELAESRDVGSVRLTERHLKHDPPEADELALVVRDARAALSIVPRVDGATLVGVAGTVTTLAAIEQALAVYDPARVHGSTLARSTVQALARRLASLPLARRREIRGLDPARADVIVAGALIVDSVLEASGAASLLVSDRGVRWGLARRALAEPTPAGRG